MPGIFRESYTNWYSCHCGKPPFKLYEPPLTFQTHCQALLASCHTAMMFERPLRLAVLFGRNVLGKPTTPAGCALSPKVNTYALAGMASVLSGTGLPASGPP